MQCENGDAGSPARKHSPANSSSGAKPRHLPHCIIQLRLLQNSTAEWNRGNPILVPVKTHF